MGGVLVAMYQVSRRVLLQCKYMPWYEVCTSVYDSFPSELEPTFVPVVPVAPNDPTTPMLQLLNKER